jgi:hypothetical protein
MDRKDPMAQNAEACWVNSVCMWLIILRLKVDFKIAEELMETMSQSDCIAWAIDIGAFN